MTPGTQISQYIRSNLLGLVAIYLALGGTALATHSGGANTISSTDIIDGQVASPDIGANAVGSAKVADNTLTSADIQTGAVESSDLKATPGAEAVGTSQLRNAAVTTPKLSFDPATQVELNAHKASADHDARYFTETELKTSDGSAPNVGSNRLHWNNLLGVPAGFADGIDHTGGPTNDLNCASCVQTGDIQNGQVQTDDLAPSVIPADGVGDNGSTKLALDSVGWEELRPGSVTSGVVRDNSLTGLDIIEEELSMGKAYHQITPGEVAVPENQTAALVTKFVPAGKYVALANVDGYGVGSGAPRFDCGIYVNGVRVQQRIQDVPLGSSIVSMGRAIAVDHYGPVDLQCRAVFADGRFTNPDLTLIEVSAVR